MKIEEILKKIDTSRMVDSDFIDFYDMCEREFDLPYWINQPKNNIRLTYCYFHEWMCTDTMVGIRVWYFDSNPVCISWKFFRKSSEVYGWLSKGDFKNVKNFAWNLHSREDNKPIMIVNDKLIEDTFKTIEGISKR